MYDHTGVFAVRYGNSTYYYRKNAQQDIISILDSNGAIVVKYKYDAWGNCVVDESTINTELANINPFRYRSYYYDTETNLYFLKTRYYDPEIGRFMTIDDISYLDPDSINGLNLYAYCLNNPVMGYDPTGTFVLSTFLICLAIGAAVGFGSTVYADYKDDGKVFNGSISFWSYLGNTSFCAAVGGFIGLTAPYIGAFISSSFPVLLPAVTANGTMGLVSVGTVTGAQIAAGVAVVLGAGVLIFASDNRPKNNQVQNKQFRKAAEKAGFNPKDPDDMDVLNEIHQYIRDNGLNLGWKKLVELMKQWRW